MRVNLDWLRDFVELDGDTAQIAADLTTGPDTFLGQGFLVHDALLPDL